MTALPMTDSKTFDTGEMIEIDLELSRARDLFPLLFIHWCNLEQSSNHSQGIGNFQYNDKMCPYSSRLNSLCNLIWLQQHYKTLRNAKLHYIIMGPRLYLSK